MGTIDIISASAGSGKTYTLSQRLALALSSGETSPESVIAVTFTKKAAAELRERVRSYLIAEGKHDDAHRLLSSYIGTVDAICNRLVATFAFDLGIPPEPVLVEKEQQKATLSRILSQQVSPDQESDMLSLSSRLDLASWTDTVHDMIEFIRLNRLDGEALHQSEAKSVEGIQALFKAGKNNPDDLESRLLEAAYEWLSEISNLPKVTKGTQTKATALRRILGDFRNSQNPKWNLWPQIAYMAHPSQKMPKDGLNIFDPVKAAAEAIDGHPGLLADMLLMVQRLFAFAEQTSVHFANRKRRNGWLDYTDMEALALDLLELPRVRKYLEEHISLVLVDEFQDTNPLQLAIFLKLASIAKHSIWVGDQKQSIFGFRDTDPKLMDAVIEQVGKGRALDVLPHSWRSDKRLIDLTSEVFAEVFEPYGIPPERVRLSLPDERSQEAEIDAPVLEMWDLIETTNKSNTILALAAGIRNLFDRETLDIHDPRSKEIRRAGFGDVAVLCRTNDTCAEVAAVLKAWNIPVATPQGGLVSTLEARVLINGMRLVGDPRDSLALAELHRLLNHPTDEDAWFSSILSDMEAIKQHDPIHDLIEQSKQHGRSGALEAFDHVCHTLDIRSLCARWGDSSKRLANVEKLRALVVQYIQTGNNVKTASSLADYLSELAGHEGDEQGIPAGGDMVTVLTIHKAKGLEWPITILFELAKTYSADPWKLSVVDDRESININDPLGFRWIRCWPNPFANLRSNAFSVTTIAQRVDDSDVAKEAAKRQTYEELRLLYVAWTRARDRLILAENERSFFTGLLAPVASTLEDWKKQPEDEQKPLSETISIRQFAPTAPTEKEPAPDPMFKATRPQEHAPAYLQPSALMQSGLVGDVVSIGERITLRSHDVHMDHVGEAIHGFFAADRKGYSLKQRLDMANGLLERWRVGNALSAESVVAGSDNLYTWIDANWKDAKYRREWPLTYRNEQGTILRGNADLVLQTNEGFIIIDHKSFPGNREQALERCRQYSGQIKAYAEAVIKGTGQPVRASYIHLPVSGMMVEMDI